MELTVQREAPRTLEGENNIRYQNSEAGCKKVARRGQTRGLREYGRGLQGERVFTENCSVGDLRRMEGGGTDCSKLYARDRSRVKLKRGIDSIPLYTIETEIEESGAMRLSTSSQIMLSDRFIRLDSNMAQTK
eukprot:sb/3474906/